MNSLKNPFHLCAMNYKHLLLNHKNEEMPASTGVYHVETPLYNRSTPRGHPSGRCIEGHTPRGTHQNDM